METVRGQAGRALFPFAPCPRGSKPTWPSLLLLKQRALDPSYSPFGGPACLLLNLWKVECFRSSVVQMVLQKGTVGASHTPRNTSRTPESDPNFNPNKDSTGCKLPSEGCPVRSCLQCQFRTSLKLRSTKQAGGGREDVSLCAWICGKMANAEEGPREEREAGRLVSRAAQFCSGPAPLGT